MDGKIYVIDATIRGDLSPTEQKISGNLSPADQKITGTITSQIIPEAFAGPYDVIPKINPQQLETAGKNMKDNVTVWGIPYTEVSNLDGTTVIIGAE